MKISDTNIYSYDLHTFLHTSTVQKVYSKLITSDLHTFLHTMSKSKKPLYTRYYIISPVEEIDTPLAEIFNYITEYLTGP